MTRNTNGCTKDMKRTPEKNAKKCQDPEMRKTKRLCPSFKSLIMLFVVALLQV